VRDACTGDVPGARRRQSTLNHGNDMNRISSVLCGLGILSLSQLALAQSVYTNLIPTRPGDHDVPNGSVVIVKNNTNSDVTITIPYEPPITVPPGSSTTIIVSFNPGGSTYVEGEGGNWRFNPR
jgi:hypothetical protein